MNRVFDESTFGRDHHRINLCCQLENDRSGVDLRIVVVNDDRSRAVTCCYNIDIAVVVQVTR